MAKHDKNFKYEIKEIIGVASEEADLHSNWCKAVLKTLMNDTDDGIDIRRYDREREIMGATGIRLTVQEAHNLADILIQNGYGHFDIIEAEYNKRKQLYSSED